MEGVAGAFFSDDGNREFGESVVVFQVKLVRGLGSGGGVGESTAEEERIGFGAFFAVEAKGHVAGGNRFVG